MNLRKTNIGYHLDDDNEKCIGTQGQIMSDVHANCFTCNQPVPIDETPVFYPIDELTPLQEVAKQQAYDDMIEEQLESDAFWSTCFEDMVQDYSYSIRDVNTRVA